MQRIFLTLMIVGNVIALVAFNLGWLIGDPATAEESSRVGLHMLFGLGALCFITLVHAIALTYFMGTGRWMEETGNAYRLDAQFRAQNQSLKYGMLPGMVLSIVLLVATGAFGAIADPATPFTFESWLGLSPAKVHFVIGALTLTVNLATNVAEYSAIRRNGEVVESVLGEVRRIRLERGLPV